MTQEQIHAPIDPGEVKLGKKLGKVEDPRTFQVRLLTTLSELTIPKAWGLGHSHPTVPMFVNDRIGDCTIASNGHRVITQERASGQSREIQLTDSDIVKAYSAVTGYDPNTGRNDNGAYMLDVANYMRKVGIGKEKDGTPHTVMAFAEIGVKEEYARAGALLFGGFWMGVWLPISAQRQPVWTVPDAGPIGPGEPGSWGGHAIYASGYDAEGIFFYTWGRLMKMTWEFFKVYVDEAYIFITEDYLYRVKQTTPRGFDVARLEGYINELR
jgi:hypothetical protein